MARKDKPFSNVVGFDDAPFRRDHRGDVAVVGTVYAGLRLDGILLGKVRRDGANALPKLHGALLKNEQDVALFERLAFMARGQR